MWHTVKEKGERSEKDKIRINIATVDSASESEEQIHYKTTEASCVVKCHDVTIVCAEDRFPYYLVELSKDPFTTESVKDDSGHYIPVNTKVIEGNYYGIFKETMEGDLYYLPWYIKISHNIMFKCCWYMSRVCWDLTNET